MPAPQANDLPAYDAAEILDTPERIAAYVDVVMEGGDPSLVAHAVGVLARIMGAASVEAEGRS